MDAKAFIGSKIKKPYLQSNCTINDRFGKIETAVEGMKIGAFDYFKTLG
jgi:ActR/RegA family two-component response regulator